MDIIWILYGYYMDITWISYGYIWIYMDITIRKWGIELHQETCYDNGITV